MRMGEFGSESVAALCENGSSAMTNTPLSTKSWSTKELSTGDSSVPPCGG